MGSKTYFVIYSNTSRNGMAGLRSQAMWTFEENIIEAAAFELRRSGESLEDLAGIEAIEDANGDVQYTRELTDEEILSRSIEKLGDDGRLYVTYGTDKAGARDFIEAAELHGLESDARAIVDKFNS